MKNIDVEFAQKHRPVGFTSCPALGLPFKLYDLYDAQTTDYRWAFLAYWLPSFLGTEEMKTLKDESLTKGRRYVWLNYSYAAVQLYSFGIRSDRAVASLVDFLAFPPAGLPPLVDKLCIRDPERGKSMVFLSKTPALDMLCGNTHAVDLKLFASYGVEDCSEEEPEILQAPEKPVQEELPEKPFIFPDWWEGYFEKIRSFNKYGDKLYRKGTNTLNKHIIESVQYINAILDGTFYDVIGADLSDKYDLSELTLDRIIKGLDDCWVREGTKPYVKDVIKPFMRKGTARSSPLLDTIFGTRFQKPLAKVKLKSFYEADKPSNAPDWIWEAHQLPSLYPEIQQDDRKFWGFYVTAIEYIDDCQNSKGTDRTKWGLWAKLNNGVTNPANNIFMDIFRSAKEAGMSIDEVYSMHMGDCSNFLWILTARRVKHSHGIKILPDGATKDNDYVYQYGPLNRTVYERKH